MLQPDPKLRVTRRPPRAGSLEHDSSYNASPCSGGHDGCRGETSRGGPRAPCKTVQALVTHTPEGLAGEESRLTRKHRSCRTSRPCSAGRASCCGPHAFLYRDGRETWLRTVRVPARWNHARLARPLIYLTHDGRDPLSWGKTWEEDETSFWGSTLQNLGNTWGPQADY